MVVQGAETLKLNKRTFIIIFVIFLIVFAYVNYAFIYQPRNLKIKQLDQKIMTLENKIEEGKRIASRLAVLKQEYAELKKKLSFLEILLPEEKEIPEFLVLLQETMDEFNIDFSNFSPQKLVREKEMIYNKFPISMTFTANYFELISFLDRLEHFPRIVDIQELKINPSGENKDIMNVNMNMFTYVLKKESE